MRAVHIRSNFVILVITVCCVVAGLAGCKAKEGASTDFTDRSQMKNDPSLPFHRAWVKPGFDKAKYTKLYVAPVNTDYMLKMTDWQSGMRKDELETDVRKLGVYTQDQIKKAFQADPNQRMQIVEAKPSSPDALLIEVALTEVVPSKGVLNALGYAPFGIGMTLTAVRMVASDVSTVAFEARIRDAATNEIVAMVADREAEQTAAVSVRGLTWYAHAEAAIQHWAAQFVQIANRRSGEVIQDTAAWTLKPW